MRGATAPIRSLILFSAWARSATTMTASFRKIDRILPRPSPHFVGDGFEVLPVFNNLAFTNAISPMLMFDYGAPREFPINTRGKPLGVGKHPHRGFETVTIAFQGQVEHHDSTGGHGVIREGDVQWMTAGRGIVHEEYHSKEFSSKGGMFEMCQLWVNLPQKYKMVKPRYQSITQDSIPSVPLSEQGDGDSVASARIIAGSLHGVQGPAKTYSPVNLWDVSLPSRGSSIIIPFPKEHSCIVFVRRGSVRIDGKTLSPQDVALFKLITADEALEITVLEKDSAVLIMGGEPLNEPIANRGPFVMNTNLEIQQAIMDYQNGRF